jgi:lantibiotic transport system ATP-binding protein
VLEGALADLKAGLGSELAIEADDPVRAAEVARSHGFVLDHAQAQLIATFTPGEDARAATAALNHALCTAGIGVHALTPRQRSLETMYRDAALPARVAA